MKAKIYTKTGDRGQSSLVDGTRVPKNHARLEAYGTLDELSSAIGLIRASLKNSSLVESRLETVQNALFNIGSRWACSNLEWITKMPNIASGAITALEEDMDTWEKNLPPLKNFILPGGTPTAAFAHLARTICRRAERTMVGFPENTVGLDPLHLIYLNRLSDWLFLLARHLNFSSGMADLEWSKD